MEKIECEFTECLCNRYGYCECSSMKNGSCDHCLVMGGNGEEPDPNARN